MSSANTQKNVGIMERNNNFSKKFCAQAFVDKLLSDGAQASCDETNDNFDWDNKLPDFYDEKLFKRGQKFFYDNFFSMMVANFLGLLTILSVPSTREMLIFTKMSIGDLKSYRRYVATLLHVRIWYDEDLNPGSKLCKSLTSIKRMHNSASKAGSRTTVGPISQKDMVLTLFGFMGFATVRGKYIGIFNPSDDDLKGLIHVWRVIGNLIGIEDRFNMCRESVQETKEICNIFLEQVFRPEIEKKEKEYLELCYYFVKGMTSFLPLLQFKSGMCMVYNCTQKDPDLTKLVYFKDMNGFQQWHYHLILNIMEGFKSYWWKLYVNYSFRLFFYIMKIFPVVAYFYYGVKNASVNIGV